MFIVEVRKNRGMRDGSVVKRPVVCPEKQGSIPRIFMAPFN